jgi:hypothetical protein
VPLRGAIKANIGGSIRAIIDRSAACCTDDLANTLRDEVALDESECFIDATFASAKGGGGEIGPTKR